MERLNKTDYWLKMLKVSGICIAGLIGAAVLGGLIAVVFSDPSSIDRGITDSGKMIGGLLGIIVFLGYLWFSIKKVRPVYAGRLSNAGIDSAKQYSTYTVLIQTALLGITAVIGGEPFLGFLWILSVGVPTIIFGLLNEKSISGKEASKKVA